MFVSASLLPAAPHCRLSINLNKVAWVRNTRPIGIPSVVRAAQLCIAAGAHGITLHARPDERHVRAHDVADIHALLQDHPTIELNLEGNPCHNLLELVRRYTPHQCTFVPDASTQATSDHGWTFPHDAALLRPLVAQAHDLGVRVSLFMDADDAANVAAAAGVGANRVELYTEPWARAHAKALRQPAQWRNIQQRFALAAQSATAADMQVNAGHDLNCANLPPLLQALPQIREVSIGHAFTADALEVGYGAAVRAYLSVLNGTPAVAPSLGTI